MNNLVTTAIIQSLDYCPYSHTSKLWLACSGGRDSMALAHLCNRLYQQGKLLACPHLIHVNHGMQSANEQWAEQVLQWASSLDMPCTVISANLSDNYSQINENIARNTRYQLISEIINDGDIVMLAHHANDQAETMLMRLFNGAGVNGLSGIKTWQTKQINNKTIYLWRPFLTITRQQITDYSIEHNLPFIDDPTNIDGDNLRSWLRRLLLPIITEQYPQAINSISRSANLCFDSHAILQEVYQQDLTHCVNNTLTIEPYNLVLNINKINQLSRPRQSQLIHQWLQGDEPYSASKQRIDEILQLIHRTDNDQQAQIAWQGENYHYNIRRYRQQLYRLRNDWLDFVLSFNIEKLIINNKLNHYQIDYQAYNINWQTVITIDNKVNNVIIRPLTNKDKFIEKPQQIAKSGKKLMQQLAIPQWQRQALLAVEIDGQILAVISPCQIWLQDDDKKKLSVVLNVIE